MNQTEFTYSPLQKKKWRAITYDYEALSVFSDQSRLYCLTDFQVAWLQSNVPYYNWITRWENTNATQQELNQQQAELELALMSCLQLQPYQLDYIYDQLQTQNIEALDALWDGVDPDSVNPDTPNDYYSGDDSNDRLNALCTACKIYVYSYAENWLAKASVGLGIAVIVGLASSITIVGGIIASVLVGGLAYVTSIAMDAMQDETALDNVVCCMFNALDGAVINSANFETALDSCGFTVGSNEAIIRDIIASDLNQFGNWLSFINQLGNSYVLAQVGVIDCPCFDFWERIFDFLPTVDTFASIFVSPPNQNASVYSTGFGWTGSSYNSGGYDFRNACRIWTQSESRDADNLKVKLESSITGTTGIFVWSCDSSGNVIETLHSQEGYVISSGENNYDINITKPTMAHAGYRFDIRSLTINIANNVYIEELIFSGVD